MDETSQALVHLAILAMNVTALILTLTFLFYVFK